MSVCFGLDGKINGDLTSLNKVALYETFKMRQSVRGKLLIIAVNYMAMSLHFKSFFKIVIKPKMPFFTS